ncbi:MAG: single-stranded-DNA-specific exonuclease RecJ [Proteobacteria bacterium]|nr:single-stranded-DNA-specific exonuclease RecJ [Pseudomonadota bacterium]
MPDKAFLGVESSATGRRWVGLNAQQDRHAQAISQQAGLPEIVARTLSRRGIPFEEAKAFLTPALRDLMPNPSVLKDMDKAADRIVQAVDKKQKIAIFADYDVDGATSAALLITWLRDFNISATLYIPDRIDEGYGPNDKAMRMLAADHDLIICVDCGTLSHAPIEAATGADVIVLDHHMGGETLPDAHAVVNPNRQDEDTEYGYLCAAGVVFLALVACNRIFKTANKPVPNLMNALDLVALGTVADVAPLIGFNRALVRQGLAIMAMRQRPGLVALADAAKMNSAPTAYHLGFLLGPRINAGGRVGKADLGARLLSTTDIDEARSIADRLNQLNDERREIEAHVQLLAMAQAEERGFDKPLVWAAGEGWHAGVVGIVAARLKEATNRPAIVIGLDGAEGKGSGRSVTGIDLGSAIATCTHEGVLLKGGGHKMAAGLTVASDNLEAAMARLSELLEKQGAGNIGPKDLQLDGAIAPSGITPELIEQLEAAGPYGAGAPAPRFALPAQRIVFAKRAGESHLRLTLQGENGSKIDAICFRAFDGPMGTLLENHNGRLFHCAGRLEIDDWGGRRRAKLRLEDVAEAL